MKFILSIIFIFSIQLTFAQSQKDSTMQLYNLLKLISEKAIKLDDVNFSKNQINSIWIGYNPASNEEIENLKSKIGISLPPDFIEFLEITNGFEAASQVEPSFCKINQIDFLSNIDPELYEIWIETGNVEIGIKMKTAIKVGGFDEEQYFFLIPPTNENNNWEYWSFASWAPGETVYLSLYDYFFSVLKKTEGFLEKK